MFEYEKNQYNMLDRYERTKINSTAYLFDIINNTKYLGKIT